jgi:general secretion pathway protein L
MVGNTLNSGADVASPDSITDIQGSQDGRFVPLSQARGVLAAHQIGVVSGADVAVLALELPKGLRGQSREQVATRQLRDQLGVDVQTVEMRPMHLPRQADQWTHIMIADRSAVAQWRSAAGSKCLAVLPDYLTLPTAKGVWTVARGEEEGRLAVRLGPLDGFGAGDALATVMLRRALAEVDVLPQEILLLGPPIAAIEEIAAEFNIDVVTDIQAANAKLLEHGELAHDLRRNPQLARARLRKRVLPWRWPLLAGMIAAAIWAAAQTIVINRITDETAQLGKQTTALVQENFVHSGPVLDARVQVARALSQARSEVAGQSERADPLELFARTAVVIASENATTALASYSTVDGLTLGVTVADFAAAERLAAQMQAAGMLVTVRDTRASDTDKGVRTTLDVQLDEEEHHEQSPD